MNKLVAIALVVGLMTGYIVSTFTGGSLLPVNVRSKDSTLFTKQFGHIAEAEIVEVSKDYLTVKDKANRKQEFPVAKELEIYRMGASNENPLPFMTVSELKAGDKVAVILELQAGAYKVTNMTLMATKK